MAQEVEAGISFEQALCVPGRTRIIAEIKKASPSKGVFLPVINVDELARIYARCGAIAISVVTEEDFFQGDLSWIEKAGQASRLPVLRKDFIFDPIQVYETRASGASAMLLIVAMLAVHELRQLLQLARENGLDALVEVHDESELQEALEAGARLIGVNNRNLKTFDVDLDTSIRLAELIPDDRFFVVESGIRTRDDILRLIDVGADAFLVGEHLLASSDPETALRGLL
jgi:indole-3-glycerol phosphate synthase